MKKLTSFSTRGKLVNGEILYDNPRYVRRMLQSHQDCSLRIVVERPRSTRSNKANRYLWGPVYETISEYTGYTKEEIHAVMTSLFLRKKVVWRDGDVTVVGSSRRLSQEEFWEFIENIRSHVAEIGIEIPDPDKDYYVKEEFGDDLYKP